MEDVFVIDVDVELSGKGDEGADLGDEVVGVPAELAEDGGSVEAEVLEGLVEAEGGVQAGAVGAEEAKDGV